MAVVFCSKNQYCRIILPRTDLLNLGFGMIWFENYQIFCLLFLAFSHHPKASSSQPSLLRVQPPFSISVSEEAVFPPGQSVELRSVELPSYFLNTCLVFITLFKYFNSTSVECDITKSVGAQKNTSPISTNGPPNRIAWQLGQLPTGRRDVSAVMAPFKDPDVALGQHLEEVVHRLWRWLFIAIDVALKEKQQMDWTDVGRSPKDPRVKFEENLLQVRLFCD